MKKNFLCVMLCLICGVGYSQYEPGTAIVRVFAPQIPYGDLLYYCVEYKSAADTLWDCMVVDPEIDVDNECYLDTYYVLHGLTPNTQYYVRVHARFLVGYDIYYGDYGHIITFYTPEEGGYAGMIDVPCGSVRNRHDVHPCIKAIPYALLLPKLTLYRSKEEWEQFC